MQPVLSVEDAQGSPVANQASATAFSLVFEENADRHAAATSELGEFILAAAEFAQAHQFTALWPPKSLVGSIGERLSAQALEIRAAVDIADVTSANEVCTPIWTEVADETEGFKQAGEMGLHVLAHILGRSIEAVAKDIALYRRAWTEARHPGQSYVTLVIPTLVGEEESVVQTAALKAMRNRLSRRPSLLRDAIWEFPAFLDASDAEGITLDAFLATRTAEEMDELVRFAADRYVSTIGLVGCQHRCAAVVEQLKQIGVDEIGCLINFGWPTDLALEQLAALNDLRLVFQERRPANGCVGPAPATNGHAGEKSTRDESSTRRPDPSLGNGTEEKLAELWGGLLDVSEIGPADNFFDLGGHSLLAARAVSEIERSFGVRLAIKTLMVSSLSQLALEIDRAAAAHSAPLQCENAVHDASAAREGSARGRLSSWFKNARNGDRFQDGSQPC